MESSQNPRITVFLVDDHEMVRDGVRALLDTEPDISVVGEAGDAEAAIGRIVIAEPDVAILDVNLPDRSGIEICRELAERCPDVRSLMLTSFGEDEALFDAIVAGAAGYVMKHVRGLDLVECVRAVARGESLIDHASADHLRARVAEGDFDPAIASLTPQERRILDLLAGGLTNRDIAEELFLSDKTVKNYVSSLLMKLGMSRRSEAAAYAARLDERRRSYVHSMTDLVPVRF
ncbi:response regulator [Ilumatobacter sp.]|uniref:response regulator n=1 Tax=Ilumatobacter sp. TaxID=1967498 RepID=UPI003AF76D9D